MVLTHRVELPPFYISEPVQRTIGCGTRLYLVPVEHATTITISAHARTSTSSWPTSGLAHLTAAMLARGTQRHTEQEFATRVDILGASFQTGSTHESIGASITGLPETSDELLTLLAESILEPRFDSTEFEKAKTRHLASFPLLLADSSYRARRIFQKLRFPGHPYNLPTHGWPSCISSITVEDVRNSYDTILHTHPWHVVAIGALDAERVVSIVEERFSNLGSFLEVTTPCVPEPSPAIGIGQGIKTEQVELRLGHTAPPLGSDDYPAALLIATAFAGHFRSRINLLVREHEGMTYGAYGGLTGGKHHGTFVLSTSTTPGNLPRMLSLLHTEWDRLAHQPLSKDELHQARQSIYSTLWRSIETPDGLAALTLELVANDLPADYYSRLLSRIDQLTPEGVFPVQQHVFNPSHLLIAAVGGLEDVAKALEPYGSPQHIMLEEEQQ